MVRPGKMIAYGCGALLIAGAAGWSAIRPALQSRARELADLRMKEIRLARAERLAASRPAGPKRPRAAAELIQELDALCLRSGAKVRAARPLPSGIHLELQCDEPAIAALLRRIEAGDSHLRVQSLRVMRASTEAALSVQLAVAED